MLDSFLDEKVRIGFILEGKALNFVESAIESLSQNSTVIVGYIGKSCFRKDTAIEKLELVPAPKLTKSLIYRLLWLFTKQQDTVLLRIFNQRTLSFLSKNKRFFRKIFYFLHNISPKIFKPNSIFRFIIRNSHFYDAFLSRVDVVIFLPTGLTDYRVIYEAKNRGKKIISWVYSWDTIYKDKFFIDFADLYLAWNQEIARDLEKQHRIDREKIKISGPVQLDYLKKFKSSNLDIRERLSNLNSSKYILYPCSRGNFYYSVQEIELVSKMAGVIRKLDKNLKLVVRTYPNIEDASIMDRLRPYENIIINDNFGIPQDRLYMSDADLNFKSQLLRNASLIINFVTTMTLEAAYFDIPILQLNFDIYVPGMPAGWRLKETLGGDHIQKYVLINGFPNIINSLDNLASTIKDALENPQKYLTYTRTLRRFVDPYPDSFYENKWRSAIQDFVKDHKNRQK